MKGLKMLPLTRHSIPMLLVRLEKMTCPLWKLTSCHTAVAAHLALYKFTLKTSPPSRFDPGLTESIPDKLAFSPLQASEGWERGVIYGQAQNLARTVR